MGGFFNTRKEVSMAWFKVDDKLWSHPKWLQTPPAARGLWITAGSWCAQHEQDGHIPANALRLLGHTRREANALVNAGLWHESDGGWVFHDWAEFQPTAAELREKRAVRAEAGRRGGLASGRSRREANASPVASPDVEAKANPVPSRPDPYPTTSNEVVRTRAKNHALPNDWEPTPEHHARAHETGLDIDREGIKFKAHADEKGRLAKNWNAAFTRWLINAADYAARDARVEQSRAGYRSQNDIMREMQTQVRGDATALIEIEGSNNP